jgi:UDP-glucose 4-epimerase
MRASTVQPAAMKGLKVLVTGGMGFIGSNIVHRCVSLGARVSVFDNLESHCGGNLGNMSGIESAIEFLQRDVLNLEALLEAVQGKDIIFHCAAITSHAFSKRDPLTSMDANVRGTMNLLEAIRRINNGCRLIHLGTTTQIGTLRFRPATEEHPEFPVDIYSASKSASEKAVLIYGNTYGLPATVVRLSNIYGPRASIHSPEFTFNNYFIGLALRDMDVTVFGDGKQLRNVLFVDDAVDALITSALAKEPNAEVYCAAADEHWTVAQIAEETVRVIGKGRACYVPWPEERKSLEFGDAVISNAKIKQRFLWTPRFTLEEGLLKTRDFYGNSLHDYMR